MATKQRHSDKITPVQRRQIRQVEETVAKIAASHGFETTCTPVNGKEVLIEHTYTNKRGYLSTKQIKIDPSINLKDLEKKMLGDKNRVGFFYAGSPEG